VDLPKAALVGMEELAALAVTLQAASMSMVELA